MNRNFTLLLLLHCCYSAALGQTYKVSGIITNTRLEPLPLASIQVKGWKSGTTTRENGHYEMTLESGHYELLVTMVGYQSRVISLTVNNRDYVQNVILEPDSSSLAEVVISTKAKDHAEEIIRQVIQHKDAIRDASGPYSCTLYIKATQQNSVTAKKKRQQTVPDTAKITDPNAELKKMAMAEIILKIDYESERRYKEERLGVTQRGYAQNLFYLSTTDGNFSLYNNLLKVPALSETPFLSPISYSGLLAYRFKTIQTVKSGNHKIYTISMRPRQLSNATVTGELTISDSGWVLLHSSFSLPSYHLPEYDEFIVEQDYGFVDSTAWMITNQRFTYYSASKRAKLSGQTVVHYKDFELNKVFGKKYFGVELSATTQKAYEQDSSFWQQNRTEPLTPTEIRFIRYKDSIYRVTHTKAYLDSMDRIINKTNWKKILFQGQVLNNHDKERNWYIPPVSSVYQPFSFGGTRIQLSNWYNKTYPSRKNIRIFSNVSYGIRNHDVNGGIRLTRMYNPFNRGYYSISLSREFEYIFSGDAWINMIKRNNFYLNNGFGIGHGLELVNGLFLHTDFDMALRRSVAGYDTNPLVDSLLGDILDDNQAVAFEPYNALYGKITLEYTPQQRYIREPKEKIIIGSAWPTFYVTWRKGINGVFQSKVDFDYLEFGIKQQLKLGLAGITNYTVKTGSFPNTHDLRLVDYQYQRRGDPLLFMNPNEAFQALDSTFPVFKRFYQGHLLHEFNGFFINKIPLLKKLQLREIAGAGFLFAPERNLRYGEIFTGVERVFKWPFNPMSKFKLGVYVVGSAANSFHNPVQFKIGITTWDKRNNKWH